MTLEWSDARYTWDPALYDGVESVPLPFSTVWTPEVILHNRWRGCSHTYHQYCSETLLRGNVGTEALPPQHGGEVHVPEGGGAVPHR